MLNIPDYINNDNNNEENEEEMIDPEDLDILEDDYDPKYEPNINELKEHAEILGIDTHKHPESINYVYTALKSRLPENWRKAVIKQTGELLFINLVDQTLHNLSPFDEEAQLKYKALLEAPKQNPLEFKPKNLPPLVESAKKNNSNSKDKNKELDFLFKSDIEKIKSEVEQVLKPSITNTNTNTNNINTNNNSNSNKENKSNLKDNKSNLKDNLKPQISDINQSSFHTKKMNFAEELLSDDKNDRLQNRVINQNQNQIQNNLSNNNNNNQINNTNKQVSFNESIGHNQTRNFALNNESLGKPSSNFSISNQSENALYSIKSNSTINNPAPINNNTNTNNNNTNANNINHNKQNRQNTNEVTVNNSKSIEKNTKNENFQQNFTNKSPSPTNFDELNMNHTISNPNISNISHNKTSSIVPKKKKKESLISKKSRYQDIKIQELEDFKAELIEKNKKLEESEKIKSKNRLESRKKALEQAEKNHYHLTECKLEEFKNAFLSSQELQLEKKSKSYKNEILKEKNKEIEKEIKILKQEITKKQENKAALLKEIKKIENDESKEVKESQMKVERAIQEVKLFYDDKKVIDKKNLESKYENTYSEYSLDEDKKFNEEMAVLKLNKEEETRNSNKSQFNNLMKIVNEYEDSYNTYYNNEKKVVEEDVKKLFDQQLSKFNIDLNKEVLVKEELFKLEIKKIQTQQLDVNLMKDLLNSENSVNVEKIIESYYNESSNTNDIYDNNYNVNNTNDVNNYNDNNDNNDNNDRRLENENSNQSIVNNNMTKDSKIENLNSQLNSNSDNNSKNQVLNSVKNTNANNNNNKVIKSTHSIEEKELNVLEIYKKLVNKLNKYLENKTIIVINSLDSNKSTLTNSFDDVFNNIYNNINESSNEDYLNQSREQNSNKFTNVNIVKEDNSNINPDQENQSYNYNNNNSNNNNNNNNLSKIVEYRRVLINFTNLIISSNEEMLFRYKKLELFLQEKDNSMSSKLELYSNYASILKIVLSKFQMNIHSLPSTIDLNSVADKDNEFFEVVYKEIVRSLIENGLVSMDSSNNNNNNKELDNFNVSVRDNLKLFSIVKLISADILLQDYLNIYSTNLNNVLNLNSSLYVNNLEKSLENTKYGVGINRVINNKESKDFNSKHLLLESSNNNNTFFNKISNKSFFNQNNNNSNNNNNIKSNNNNNNNKFFNSSLNNYKNNNSPYRSFHYSNTIKQINNDDFISKIKDEHKSNLEYLVKFLESENHLLENEISKTMKENVRLSNLNKEFIQSSLKNYNTVSSGYSFYKSNPNIFTSVELLEGSIKQTQKKEQELLKLREELKGLEQELTFFIEGILTMKNDFDCDVYDKIVETKIGKMMKRVQTYNINNVFYTGSCKSELDKTLKAFSNSEYLNEFNLKISKNANNNNNGYNNTNSNSFANNNYNKINLNNQSLQNFNQINKSRNINSTFTNNNTVNKLGDNLKRSLINLNSHSNNLNDEIKSNISNLIKEKSFAG